MNRGRYKPKFRLDEYVVVKFVVPDEWPGFSDWKKRLLVAQVVEITDIYPYQYRLRNPLDAPDIISAEIKSRWWKEDQLLHSDEQPPEGWG